MDLPQFDPVGFITNNNNSKIINFIHSKIYSIYKNYEIDFNLIGKYNPKEDAIVQEYVKKFYNQIRIFMANQNIKELISEFSGYNYGDTIFFNNLDFNNKKFPELQSLIDVGMKTEGFSEIMDKYYDFFKQCCSQIFNEIKFNEEILFQLENLYDDFPNFKQILKMIKISFRDWIINFYNILKNLAPCLISIVTTMYEEASFFCNYINKILAPDGYTKQNVEIIGIIEFRDIVFNGLKDNVRRKYFLNNKFNPLSILARVGGNSILWWYTFLKINRNVDDLKVQLANEMVIDLGKYFKATGFCFISEAELVNNILIPIIAREIPQIPIMIHNEQNMLEVKNILTKFSTNDNNENVRKELQEKIVLLFQSLSDENKAKAATLLSDKLNDRPLSEIEQMSYLFDIKTEEKAEQKTKQLKDIFQEKVLEFNKKIEELQNDLNNKQKQINEKSDKIKQIEKEKEKIVKNIETLSNENEILKNKETTLNETIEKYKNEINKLKILEDNLTKREQALQQEIQLFNKRKIELENEKTNLNSKIEILKKEKIEKEEQIKKINNEIKEKDKDIKNKENEINSLKINIAKLEEKNNYLNQIILQLNNKENQKIENIKEIFETNAGFEYDEKQSLEVNISYLIKIANENINNNNIQIKELNEKIEEKDNEKNNLLNEIKELKQTRIIYQQEFNEIQQNIEKQKEMINKNEELTNKYHELTEKTLEEINKINTQKEENNKLILMKQELINQIEKEKLELNNLQLEKQKQIQQLEKERESIDQQKVKLQHDIDAFSYQKEQIERKLLELDQRENELNQKEIFLQTKEQILIKEINEIMPQGKDEIENRIIEIIYKLPINYDMDIKTFRKLFMESIINYNIKINLPNVENNESNSEFIYSKTIYRWYEFYKQRLINQSEQDFNSEGVINIVARNIENSRALNYLKKLCEENILKNKTEFKFDIINIGIEDQNQKTYFLARINNPRIGEAIIGKKTIDGWYSLYLCHFFGGRNEYEEKDF